MKKCKIFKNRKIIVGLGLAIFIIITGFLSLRAKNISSINSSSIKEVKEYSSAGHTGKTTIKPTEYASASSSYKIYICGCVKNPGLYEFKKGDRVGDCVNRAGGFSDNADINSINLARLVNDGEQIYISEKISDIGSKDTSKIKNINKININLADKEELMQLPGIGASRADSIIQFRKENGPFTDIQDLTKIPGIKASAFNKIKELISI